jgi:hypothetical protein
MSGWLGAGLFAIGCENTIRGSGSRDRLSIEPRTLRSKTRTSALRSGKFSFAFSNQNVLNQGWPIDAEGLFREFLDLTLLLPREMAPHRVR